MTLIYNEAIAARIKFLIQTLRTSQAAFARQIGVDPANMSKHLSGKLPITKGLINRIVADMGVSKNWLLTGDGIPFAKESAHPAQAELPEVAPAFNGIGTPIYDIDVTAGCIELSRMFTSDRIIGSVNIPSLQPDSVIVRVYGDSMEPEIADGGFVAIRPISDPSCIFWGQYYVVVLDDYRMVKQIRKNHNPERVTLHSINPQYDDIEIEQAKIRRLFLVETILNMKIKC